jgi:hypothetical protein
MAFEIKFPVWASVILMAGCGGFLGVDGVVEVELGVIPTSGQSI